MKDDKINVLLVEDNPGDAKLIVELLKDSEDSDYTVTTAEDLSTAVILFTDHKFDIIILDLNLPDSSGIATLCSIIKLTENLVPVIVLTGIENNNLGISSLAAGADDYLTKGEILTHQLKRSIAYSIERKKTINSLIESENRYRSLHESMFDAFVQVNMKGLIIEFNHSYLEMLGYLPDEIKNLNYCDITPVKWHDFEAEIVKNQILVNGYSDIYEKEYRRKDGMVFPVELRTYLLRDRTGNPAGMWAIVRDITARKLIEEQLKESREIYKTFIDSSDERIFLKDEQFRNIMINKKNAAFLGKSFNEIIGKTDFDLLPHEIAVKNHESDTLVLSINSIVTGEEIQNGRIYEIRKFPVKFTNDKTGIGGYIRDVTERKKTEESLLLRSTALENAANGIIITDTNGIIIWSNPAFELLSGYSFDEAVGHNPRELVKSGENDRKFYKKLWDTIISGKVWKGEIVNRRKDGTLYTEEMTIAPVKDDTGKIHNYIAIKQDITERNLAIKILKDSLSEKRELIREIYHRTKNNMQVIISMFSLQSMLDDDEKVTKVLKDMENRIRTMALVHEKLYQSRELSKLNLKDYLLELINNITTGYIPDSKKIVIKEQMENLEVLIDTATTCGLVVNELVTNAAKYAFTGMENGELGISLARDKAGEITLIIADNGCGTGLNINLDNTESMGIQIVKNIVEYQMKGNIKLDNSRGVKWIITFKDNVYTERI